MITKMSQSFTLTDNCEHDLLNVIEKYLKELPPDDQPKIYFSGEFDSNQTKFEYKSNNLEIGVLAYNKTVALVLLRFLRIIIDDNTDLLIEDSFWSEVTEFDAEGNYITETYKAQEKLDITEIIRKISDKEEDYMNCFSLNGSIHTNFIKEEENFVKRLDEIDIWTLPRIMNAMRDLY